MIIFSFMAIKIREEHFISFCEEEIIGWYSSQPCVILWLSNLRRWALHEKLRW